MKSQRVAIKRCMKWRTTNPIICRVLFEFQYEEMKMVKQLEILRIKTYQNFLKAIIYWNILPVSASKNLWKKIKRLWQASFSYIFPSLDTHMAGDVSCTMKAPTDWSDYTSRSRNIESRICLLTHVWPDSADCSHLFHYTNVVFILQNDFKDTFCWFVEDP